MVRLRGRWRRDDDGVGLREQLVKLFRGKEFVDML